MKRIPAVLLLMLYSFVVYAIDGAVAGKIGNVNKFTGEIVVNTGDSKSRIEIGDKLYVRIDGEPVVMKAAFPMLTVVKCTLESKYKKNLDDLESGMTVYRYKPGIEKKEESTDTVLEDTSGDTSGTVSEETVPSLPLKFHNTVWKIVCPGGDPETYFVIFKPDGNMGYSYKDADSMQFDNTDSWHVENDKLVIIWTNGYSTEKYLIVPDTDVMKGRKTSRNYEGEKDCTIEKVR